MRRSASIWRRLVSAGTIGVVDSDVVDVTNLQRQVIYATSDIDRPKLEASAQRLRDLNPTSRSCPTRCG